MGRERDWVLMTAVDVDAVHQLHCVRTNNRDAIWQICREWVSVGAAGARLWALGSW